MIPTLIEHALTDCTDPDCEIHCPWVIETDSERRVALAWYAAAIREYGSADKAEAFIRDHAADLSS